MPSGKVNLSFYYRILILQLVCFLGVESINLSQSGGKTVQYFTIKRAP